MRTRLNTGANWMSHYRIRTKSAGSVFRKQWHVLWLVLAVLFVPFLLTALVIVKQFWSEHPQKLAADRDVHLNVTKLHTNRLRMFETAVSGHNVQFVVERTQGQNVHVAVAACRYCYRERRSNRVRDGAVICGRCSSSMDFAPFKATVYVNRCNLAEIPHQQTQQTLTVMARDIAQTITKLAQP